MKISTITPNGLRGEGLVGFRALDGAREQRLIDYGLLKGRHYMNRAAGMSMSMRGGDRQPVNLTQQMVKTLIAFLAMNYPVS